jgi:pyruvate dehydrogenase E2 component (dihydrolipoamide acetyltransferase)
VAQIEIHVPDIGDFSEIPVVEIAVAAGSVVAKEDPLVTLESDKATLDIPAPFAGTVVSVAVAEGDLVSQGSLVCMMETQTVDTAVSSSAPDAPPLRPDAPTREPNAPTRGPDAATRGIEPAPPPQADEDGAPPLDQADHTESSVASVPSSSASGPRRPSPTAALTGALASAHSHATPTIRRFARELGVDLTLVTGTGRKGRIVKEDVRSFVKERLGQPAAATTASGAGIPPIPAVDFEKFGPVDLQPLSRIQRVSGPHLHRAWLNIPHVTHHDETDVTDVEAFRQSIKADAATRGVRITMLAFVTKALAAALRDFPIFNASLSPDGESLVLKRYFHVGIAVDTPNGLVVPVIRDVNQLGIFELAEKMADVSERARDGRLKADDLRGGCISISSLGGIGGIGFTPIVNAPEVAILGVSKSRMQPVWNGSDFVPRLMLPLDLSYDHRVIDGAAAARFTVHLATLLSDVRRLLL